MRHIEPGGMTLGDRALRFGIYLSLMVGTVVGMIFHGFTGLVLVAAWGIMAAYQAERAWKETG